MPNGWWTTLKQFIKPDQTNIIPPLNKDGLIYSDEIYKANILYNYFTEQTLLDESQAALLQTMTTPTYNLDSLSLSLLHLKRLNKL